jgi:hypothetical protein
MLEHAEYMRRMCASETSGSVDAVCHMNSLFESILIVRVCGHRLVFCGAFARHICVVCRCGGLCARVGLR